MLGAFFTYSAMPHLMPDTVAGFALSVLLAGLAVAALGALFEVLVLRRTYGADDLLQLIITVALVLVVRDLVREVWGPNNVTVPMPAALSGAVQVGGSFFPMFQLAVFGIGTRRRDRDDRHHPFHARRHPAARRHRRPRHGRAARDSAGAHLHRRVRGRLVSGRPGRRAHRAVWQRQLLCSTPP